MAQTIIEQLKASCTDKKILMQDGEEITAESQFVFQQSFSGFDGHFPGMPILPAIMQLAAVRLTVEMCTGNNYVLTGLDGNKFKGIIRPKDLLLVHVKVKNRDDGLRGSFTMTVDGNLMSSGKFGLARRGCEKDGL